MALLVERIQVGPMDNNCYLISDSAGGETLVVDPSFDNDAILKRMKGKTPVGILLTHGHFDHINLIDPLRSLWGVPVMIHTADSGALTDSSRNASLSLLRRTIVYQPAERTLRDGETIAVGAEKLTVRHTPGHTAGSCCFFGAGDESFLLTGDTLFCGSVGRTDLPTGDIHQLVETIKGLKSFGILHPDTRIFPGHGSETVFRQEIEHNPYFQ